MERGPDLRLVTSAPLAKKLTPRAKKPAPR
jgi:hypothetical protein